MTIQSGISQILQEYNSYKDKFALKNHKLGYINDCAKLNGGR